jgi:hypothetical protein
MKRFSIKLTSPKTLAMNEYYLQTGSGQCPNRTLLSTNFSWVKCDLRTKYDLELALKWLKFLATKTNPYTWVTLTLVQEKDE